MLWARRSGWIANTSKQKTNKKLENKFFGPFWDLHIVEK